ncbi:class A beta-lactamase-related serine hydrolase [Nocardioides marmoriginsengisoli]|uniref:Class A beta-lactamase-related serine hydrolase n=1 Tax=Nocardioides marmoriginsengisoli TaxID=661483 RepID=A0A3N0CQV5_9ACTN|nr:class A beta-lactamase-related serine hydrolase [Nocardioides marmoriginsengisoli]
MTTTDAPRRQAVLDRAQAEGRLPSVVGALSHAGELTWHGVAGDAGAVDAQYRIGSITKTLTAVLVLQCRDDGLLDLDDPLSRHLPGSGYGAATIRTLLGHASGMQAEPVGPWWERSPGVDLPALLAANDGSGQVLPAGVAFHYSNLAFALLGEVVSRCRGASWTDLVQDRLLTPLGMSRTGYQPTGEHAQGYSVGHFAGTLTREPHEDTGAMAPAGQLWSTLADLARWVDFLAVGHPEILSAATLTEMSEPAPFPEYGLGLRRLAAGGRLLIGHTGSMPGFQACAFVDRGTREGGIVLANATTGLRSDQIALDLLAGQDPYDGERWSPSYEVPERARELLGLWFWGNTAHELRWTNQQLELRTLQPAELSDRFVIEPDRIRGVEGYLLGETLQVRRAGDGSVDSWECATFRFTRTPYDA